MNALIAEGVVVEIADGTFEVAEPLSWEPAPQGCKPGWLFKEGQFIDPDAKTDEEKAADDLSYLRSERNKLLLKSDWTQYPDSPLADAKKLEWAEYRQSLRDITQTFQSVNDDGFAWPQEPTA